MAKIKVKQLQSGSQPFGQVIISDGSGNTVFSDISGITYPLDKGTSFPSSPTGGSLYYRTDEEALFHYDDSRSKWFTVKTLLYSCGRTHIKKNVSAYMYVGTAVQSSTNGFIMTKNGTILSGTIDNSNVMGTIRNTEIRVNDSTTNKVTLAIPSSSKSYSTITANQNFSSGDVIQVISIANGGTDLDNVIVTFEIAWRV